RLFHLTRPATSVIYTLSLHDALPIFESAGADIEQVLHAAVILNHDRQAAPIAAAGGRGQALDDLLLQHEMHVADQVGMIEQVENQRRGDVVGQVADDAQAVCIFAEPGEIEFERISLVQVKVRQAAEFALQDRYQVKVKFNDIQPRAAVQQTLGQGTLARTDFHQMLAGTRINAPQDAMNHARIMQKILAKALACAVLVFGHQGSSRLRLHAAGATLKTKRKEAQFTSEPLPHAARHQLLWRRAMEIFAPQTDSCGLVAA